MEAGLSYSSTLSCPNLSSGARVSIIPPALVEHLLESWHGAGGQGHGDKKTQWLPWSPQEPWGQRETELPVLGADTLTHFSAQGLFAQ